MRLWIPCRQERCRCSSCERDHCNGMKPSSIDCGVPGKLHGRMNWFNLKRSSTFWCLLIHMESSLWVHQIRDKFWSSSSQTNKIITCTIISTKPTFLTQNRGPYWIVGWWLYFYKFVAISRGQILSLQEVEHTWKCVETCHVQGNERRTKLERTKGLGPSEWTTPMWYNYSIVGSNTSSMTTHYTSMILGQWSYLVWNVHDRFPKSTRRRLIIKFRESISHRPDNDEWVERKGPHCMAWHGSTPHKPTCTYPCPITR